MEKPWIKFYDPHVPRSLEYPKIPLQQILDESADRFPGTPAIFFFEGKLRYGELRAQANRFSSALRGLGFRKGGRVGLLSANMPQAVISTFGVLKAGGVVVFCDPLLAEEELQRQLHEEGVETLVVLDLVLPRVEQIFARTKIKHLIITGVKDYLPFPQDFLFSLAARGRGMNIKVEKRPNTHFFKEFLASGSADPPVLDGTPFDPEEVAVIQYTEGTSGPPKGVLLTHKNLMANLLQASAWIGRWEKGKERFLSILPFHRAYGMTMAMNLPVYLAAASIHLPRFDLKQVLSAVRKHRPSFFPALPSMIETLSSDPGIAKYNVSSIKVCWSIGKPLPEDALQNLERQVGRRVNESYGLTEASSLTHANPLYGKRKAGSIGIPLPDTDARIVDPVAGEKEMPVGEPGELIIKGPQVMKGYWNMPEETARTLRHGWLHTGDLARMDEDGYFFIVGKLPKKL